MSSSTALYRLMPVNSHLNKDQKNIYRFCCCFSSLENPLEQYQSTLEDAGGGPKKGLKLQQAEADVMSLQRTEKSCSKPEVKVSNTKTPPTWQGSPRLLFHRRTTPLLSNTHTHTYPHTVRSLNTRYLCVTLAV